MEAAAESLDPSLTAIYKPRRPHQTPLYRLVQEHLETFLADSREACLDDDPIPEYVERTFRKYLECGIPAVWDSSTSTPSHTTCPGLPMTAAPAYSYHHKP